MGMGWHMHTKAPILTHVFQKRVFTGCSCDILALPSLPVQHTNAFEPTYHSLGLIFIVDGNPNFTPLLTYNSWTLIYGLRMLMDHLIFSTTPLGNVMFKHFPRVNPLSETS